MNNQNATSVVGASKGTDFQPSTQNPQSNVSSSLQPTGAGLQTAGGEVLGARTNILVPTATGTISIAPTSPAAAVQPTVSKYTNPVVWLGAGIVILLLVVMSVGLLRPRKYS